MMQSTVQQTGKCVPYRVSCPGSGLLQEGGESQAYGGPGLTVRQDVINIVILNLGQSGSELFWLDPDMGPGMQRERKLLSKVLGSHLYYCIRDFAIEPFFAKINSETSFV